MIKTSEHDIRTIKRFSEKDKDLIKITVIGFVASLMVLMMIYVIFAQVFLNYIEGSIAEQFNLSIIIIGMFSISLISSVLVGYLLAGDDVEKRSILKASFVAYVFTILTIIGISYLALFLYYPSIFEGLFGFDYVSIVSVVIVYFTVYVLPQFYWLYILEVIFYYLYFIILLNIYYEYKEEKPVKRNARFM